MDVMLSSCALCSLSFGRPLNCSRQSPSFFLLFLFFYFFSRPCFFCFYQSNVGGSCSRALSLSAIPFRASGAGQRRRGGGRNNRGGKKERRAVK